MNLDTNCLEINKETAELVGIILGDGSIGIYPERWQHQLDISLNNIDEPNYVIYVKHLMESIFNEKVNLSNISGKGVSLRYYKKDIIESLLKLGLVAGNKTKHQVSVPVNILNNQNFAKLCLKGLFDTDGSVSIDSATDLRLMFSSCSKPLALNFYNICNSLGIDPSPSIIYNSKRRSWRIMIAKKDSINKFLTLIKPEKLKEPYRRIWLGCKILHLNSEYATIDKINYEISMWLKKTSQMHFRYSKKNSLFLKSICEKYLQQVINDDTINKAISQILRLDKFMYSKKSAKKLKILYEKLHSSKRIVEYFIDCGMINIPNRQTINKHLKRYFKSKNEDYKSWLEKYPIWSIGIENDHITYFPQELRNLLCFKIMQIIINTNRDISKFNLKNLLMKEFRKSGFLLMTWLNQSPNYHLSFNYFLDSIIYFMKKILLLSKKSLVPNFTELSKDPKIHFHRKAVGDIIEYLEDSKIINF